MSLETVVFLAVLLRLGDACIMLLVNVSYHLETQVNHLALVSNIVLLLFIDSVTLSRLKIKQTLMLNLSSSLNSECLDWFKS